MSESVRPLFRRLTPAEIDLLLWFSRGYESADELAQLLGCRPSTVLTELATVFKKLGVHTRSQLMGLIQWSAAVSRGGATTNRPAPYHPAPS